MEYHFHWLVLRLIAWRLIGRSGGPDRHRRHRPAGRGLRALGPGLVRQGTGLGRVGGGPLGLDEPAPQGLRGLVVCLIRLKSGSDEERKMQAFCQSFLL